MGSGFLAVRLQNLEKSLRLKYGATLVPDGWVGGPMMKVVAEFEESLKKYPPIAPGTPDPYTPRKP
jgi:arylsulfatase